LETDTPSPAVTVRATVVFAAVRESIPLLPGSAIPPPRIVQVFALVQPNQLEPAVASVSKKTLLTVHVAGAVVPL
jgi:hypothetical protein